MSDGYHGLLWLASGWAAAIVRAAWQGGLAIALVWLLCRALPRLSGRTQCWLWRLAYLKLLLAFVWTAPVMLPLLPAGLNATQLESPRRHGDTERDRRRIASLMGLAGRTRWTESTRMPVQPQRATPSVQASPAQSRLSRMSPTPCLCVSVVIRKSAALISRAGLLLLWLLGAAGYGIRLRADGHRAQRLRARGQLIQDPTLIHDCRELCRQLGIEREPALMLADEPGCPSLVGVTHPAVVLPASFLERFSRGELRLMLAHELAHLKRRDLLWSWLPNLSRMLFYFHPLVWLAEAEWRLAQEMACDEQVMLATGASRKGYAAMLLAVMAEPQPFLRAPLLTVGVVESYATVRRRLLALRDERRGRGRSAARPWAWMGSLLAITGAASLVPWQLTARAMAQSAPANGVMSSHAHLQWVPGLAKELAVRPAAASPMWITIQERRAATQRLPPSASEASDRGITPGQPEVSDAPASGRVLAFGPNFTRLKSTRGNQARTDRAVAHASRPAARLASTSGLHSLVIGEPPGGDHDRSHPEGQKLIGRMGKNAAAPFSWIGLEGKSDRDLAAADPLLSPQEAFVQASLDPPGMRAAAAADDRSAIHLKQPSPEGSTFLAEMPPWGLKPRMVALIRKGEKPGFFPLPKPFASFPEGGPEPQVKLPPELVQKLMDDPSIDHRMLKKLLADPSLDPRVLKKILAGMALRSAADGPFPNASWLDPADQQRFYAKLDALKKQSQKEPASVTQPREKTAQVGDTSREDDTEP